jgi:predicted acyltransferase
MATPLPQPASRLVSLDAFRGLTIAGMILVNTPGSWSHIYGPLRHADWHGLTPTDLVFPFFLFIVGVSITLAFQRRLEQGATRGVLLAQIVRRSALLVLLGWSMGGFPNWRLIGPFVLAIVGLGLWRPGERTDGDGPLALQHAAGRWPWRRLWRTPTAAALVLAAVAWFAADFAYYDASRLRAVGVLPRIGLCYLAAGLIVLSGGVGWRVGWTVVLLAGYAAILAWASPPVGYEAKVVGPEGLLHNWIDEQFLGTHLYRERPDPEGLLSTLPAIATVLCGVLTGHWLRGRRDARDMLIGLFFAANVLLVLGLWWATAQPLNKKIWTSSYVLVTAGLAMHGVAMCYWLIDVKGVRRWATPMVMFGSNAITIFVASGLMAKMLGRWKVGDGTMSASGWFYRHGLASWAGEKPGSLMYAVLFVLFWLIPAAIMYRRRWIVKV